MTLLEILDHEELLRNRMGERSVTIEEVRAYVVMHHSDVAQGMLQQDVNTFVTEADLPAFWWLHDWWLPVDQRPANLPVPNIRQFCWSFQYVPGNEPVTFNQALEAYYHKCLAWCEEAKIDPANPGESPEQRKLRLNRERMANTRAGRKASVKSLSNLPLQLVEEVSALEQKRDQLKEEAKAADEQLAATVVEYQKQMIAASGERKRAREYFRNEIEILSKEIAGKLAKR